MNQEQLNQKSGLINGADINVRNSYVTTNLFNTVENNNKEMTELLLSKGADINARNSEDETVLFTAVKNNNREMIQLLLSKGADINARKYSGETALFSCVRSGKKEMIEFLLSKGADINAKDLYGGTALLCCVRFNEREMIEFLLSKGANINAKDINGRTALFTCIGSGKKEMTEFLLSKGADINAKNCLDQTVLSNAVWRKNKEIIKILISNGSNLETKNLSLSEEIKAIIISAKAADSLFDSQVVVDHEQLQNIDAEIFISRFNFKLKNFEGSLNEITEVISKYNGFLKNHDQIFNLEINEKIKELFVEKYISYYKDYGVNLDYQTEIENIHNNNALPEYVKNAISDLLKQEQDDFNLKCASIFSRVFEGLSPCPINLVAEYYISALRETDKENNTFEIGESALSLFDFYNNNSELKTAYLEDYFTGKIKEDENIFNAKVTAANIGIFHKHLNQIVSKCPEYLEDISELVLPVHLVTSINDFSISDDLNENVLELTVIGETFADINNDL